MVGADPSRKWGQYLLVIQVDLALDGLQTGMAVGEHSMGNPYLVYELHRRDLPPNSGTALKLTTRKLGYAHRGFRHLSIVASDRSKVHGGRSPAGRSVA